MGLVVYLVRVTEREWARVPRSEWLEPLETRLSLVNRQEACSGFRRKVSTIILRKQRHRERSHQVHTEGELTWVEIAQLCIAEETMELPHCLHDFCREGLHRIEPRFIDSFVLFACSRLLFYLRLQWEELIECTQAKDPSPSYPTYLFLAPFPCCCSLSLFPNTLLQTIC